MNKHNAVSLSIIGLLFILLLTPTIVSSSLFFPYITGKAFAFRIISTIVIISYLFLVLKKPNFLPSKSIVLGSGALLLVWMAISNMFGVDPSSSFFSNFERMEGWFTHAYLFAFLVIISSIFQSEKLWNWFFGISTIIANYVAFEGLQGTEERIGALLGNSTYVAIYMLFNMFFAVLLLYRLYNSNIKDTLVRYTGYSYYIFSIILFLYIILRTQTRGTMLALIFSTGLFCFLTLISYWKHKVVRIASLSALILMIVGSVLFWQNKDAEFIQSSPILDRITTISISEGTGRSRILTWGIGLEGIAERPLMGWGQENYSYVFAQKYNPEMYDKEPWFDRTHNVFLDWLVHHGIIGFALYILFILTCVYAIFTSSSFTRVEKNLLYSVILGYCVHNVFVFDSYSSYLLFFSIVGFIIFHSKKEKLQINLQEYAQQILVILLSVVIVVTSYFTVVLPYFAAKDLLDTMRPIAPEEVISTYQNIFSKNSFGIHEAGLRYVGLVSGIKRLDSEELTKQYIEHATQVGESLVSKKPDDVRFLEVYGAFLLQVENYPRAIEVLTHARDLAPNRQNNLYDLGFVYIKTKEYDKALEVFKHAYEIYPQNDKARQYYGAALLLAGDQKGKELIQGYSYKDPFFFSTFLNLKQYDEAVKIREKIIIENPTDYQSYVSLAVAYVLNNQRAKAIETIRFVQSKVPEFKGQGDQLIRDIQAGKIIGVE